jgi:hypothetical protein
MPGQKFGVGYVRAEVPDSRRRLVATVERLVLDQADRRPDGAGHADPCPFISSGCRAQRRPMLRASSRVRASVSLGLRDPPEVVVPWASSSSCGARQGERDRRARRGIERRLHFRERTGGPSSAMPHRCAWARRRAAARRTHQVDGENSRPGLPISVARYRSPTRSGGRIPIAPPEAPVVPLFAEERALRRRGRRRDGGSGVRQRSGACIRCGTNRRMPCARRRAAPRDEGYRCVPRPGTRQVR